jgi:hypothetical protein
LKPGAECTVSVKYTSKSIGVRTSTLLISDASCDCTQAVSLMGTSGRFMALDRTKTYLVNRITGHPVFILGDAANDLAINLSAESDIDLYLSTRQSQGFNALWVEAVDIAYAIDPPRNVLGQAPFIDMSAPFVGENEAYWEHLDYVLERAAAYGFMVFLTPAQAGSGASYCLGWCPYLQAASTSTLMAYGEYLGNRYKRYPNIIWLLGGDLDLVHYPQLQAKVEAILGGIRLTDPYHMTTEANEPGTTGYNSQDYKGGTPWPPGAWALNSFYHNYSGTPGEGVMTTDANDAWTRSNRLPSLSQQDSYENNINSGTALQERMEAYQAVLGGMTLGVFLGNEIMWTFGYKYQYSSGYTGPTQWKNWFVTPATTARIHLARLMRSREFWKMSPDTSRAVLTGSYGSGANTDAASCTSDGQTCMVYDPLGNSQAPQIAMSHFSGEVRAWWFNPETGATTDLGRFANRNTHTFTPADGNDWVLVLDLASLNLPAPGSANL